MRVSSRKKQKQGCLCIEEEKALGHPLRDPVSVSKCAASGLGWRSIKHNWHLASWCGFMSLLLRWWLQLYLLLVCGDKEVGKDENSPLFKTDHLLTLILTWQFLRQGAHPSWFTSSKQLSLKVTLLISPHRSHSPVTIPFICPISFTCSALFPSPLMVPLNVN